MRSKVESAVYDYKQGLFDLNPKDRKAYAALYNPGHGGNGADYSDAWNQFYCLDGVWDPCSDTEIVSPEKLQSIIDEFQ